MNNKLKVGLGLLGILAVIHMIVYMLANGFVGGLMTGLFSAIFLAVVTIIALFILNWSQETFHVPNSWLSGFVWLLSITIITNLIRLILMRWVIPLLGLTTFGTALTI